MGDVRLDDIQVSVAMHDGPQVSAKVTHATVAWPDGKVIQWDVTASDTRMDGQEMPELLPFDMSSEGTWTLEMNARGRHKVTLSWVASIHVGQGQDTVRNSNEGPSPSPP